MLPPRRPSLSSGSGLSRDSPDESRTGLDIHASPALLQDRRAVCVASEGCHLGACSDQIDASSVVIAGLDPAIHLLREDSMRNRWTPGSSPIGAKIAHCSEESFMI